MNAFSDVSPRNLRYLRYLPYLPYLRVLALLALLALLLILALLAQVAQVAQVEFDLTHIRNKHTKRKIIPRRYEKQVDSFGRDPPLVICWAIVVVDKK